jgi:hypothetical protein
VFPMRYGLDFIYYLEEIRSSKGYRNYYVHLLQHTNTLHSAHTVYLCVLYGSHNKPVGLCSGDVICFL